MFIRKITYHLFFVLMLMSGSRFSSYAQPGVAAEIGRQLTSFAQQNFQEKIFAHTDKSFYICGEIMWFKLYNVDAYLNKPVAISKVAYAELLNNEHKPVLQAKVDMVEGEGSGSFMLPFSLNSGIYLLRVYTSWMKNFGPDLFFEKEVTIINTLKKLPGRKDDVIASGIQFFPEGGNLVNGLQSKVAFQAVNQDGRGIACKGVVFNQNNDSITSFESFRFGIGNFSLKPEKGNTYKAVIRTATGETFNQDLPMAYDKGYVMRLDLPDKKTIRVSVHSAGYDEGSVSLLAHTRHVVKKAETKDLVNGMTEFFISKEDLDDGISHFTLFDSKRQAVCERLFFKRPAEKLNIEIINDQEVYKRRGSVSIGLSATDIHQKPVQANLSLSVFRVDSFQVMDHPDIRSYFWLSSELRGNIDSASFYFSSDEQVESAADNLMLTQGWRRFKWESVFSNTNTRFPFLPEYEGPVIKGRIRDRVSGKAASNITTYLTVPGNHFVFKSVVSDPEGNILFNPEKFYGSSDIVIQAQSIPNSSYHVEIDPPFSTEFSSRKHASLFISEKWQDQLLSNSIGMQVENTYVQEKKQLFYSPYKVDTTSFFGGSDKTYFLDDYTRFITLEEVMREYVTEVRVRKQEGNFFFKVKNGTYNVFFDNDPLVLLDGLPVFDINKLMEFDPLKIKKLDLITQKYFSGNNVIEGIVSYSTYKGDLDGFPIDPNAVVLEYQGLQLQREFYSPLYETPAQVESTLPDFRNVLNWSPGIKTAENGNAQVSFYTSDRPGEYAVLVQGLSSNGLAGSKLAFFTVQE